jgi:hypothetical protein
VCKGLASSAPPTTACPAGGGPCAPCGRSTLCPSVDFLLSYDVARAEYPYKERINSSWFKFGYPLGYVTDVLLNLEALAEAGCGDDPRLEEAVELTLSKQDEAGHWKLEYGYKSKMWADIEKKGRPSKWVTLRATRVLKRFHGGLR